MRRTLPPLRFWLLVLIVTCYCRHLKAERWSTGDGFRRQLRQPVGVTWADMPLAEALPALAKTQNVAIFLDRRVDPSTKVSATTEVLPFVDALQAALQPLELAVGFVGPVVYVGPRQTAARIATLAELRNQQSREKPLALHTKLLRQRPLMWAELSEPRTVVAKLVRQAGLEFENSELIPHDLWKAVELPPMTMPEALTLILAGFNMNFTIQDTEAGPQFRLTKFPWGVAIERDYDGGAAPAARLAEMEALLPHAVVKPAGKRLVVRSLLEDHWALERQFAPQQATAPPGTKPARRAYTLRVENKPAGQVLQVLATQLGMSIDFAPETIAAQEKLVSFSVDKVSGQQLLEAAAAPADLKVNVEGQTIQVSKR